MMRRVDVGALNSRIKALFGKRRIKEASQLFEEIPIKDRDVTVCNTVITGYSRNSMVGHARHVFDRMPCRNKVSWNALLAGYAHNRRLADARQLFDEMPERSIVAWNTLLSAYANAARVEDAKSIFDYMPSRDVVSWNTMLSCYARNGMLHHAQQLFDVIPSRDIVSWNTLLSAYAKNKELQKARVVFDTMPMRDMVSWNAMISAYTQNHMLKEARQLFDKMHNPDPVSGTLLVVGYSQLGKVEEAKQIFNSMPEKSLVSWNALLSGVAQHGRMEDARQLFNSMVSRDTGSWNTMITAYARIGGVTEAQELFDKMPSRDLVSWNAIISANAQNHRLDIARMLFEKMPQRNSMSWSAMITGYEQCGQFEEALRLFCRMTNEQVKPDKFSFTSTLSACAGMAALTEGRQVQQHGLKIGVAMDVPMANSLITMYSKCGVMEDAKQIFHEMPKRDFVSWNAIISGCAQQGFGREGLWYFREMVKNGVGPTEITFVSVLYACNHGGLVEEGRNVFHSMTRDFGIVPTGEHCACMVDLLGRSGLLSEAEQFAKRTCSDSRNSSGDVGIWGALLGACRVHGNVKIACRAAQRLFELEPYNSGPYVLLSNIYAAAGRWKDAHKVRQMMKERGVETE